MVMFTPICLQAVLAALAIAQTTPLTGRHTELPRWCGKPYKKDSPNFDPGGQLYPPPSQPNKQIYLQVAPKHSIYVDSETTAEFIVDAELSKLHGKPLGKGKPSGTLYFEIRQDSVQNALVSDKVAVGTMGTTFKFDLAQLKPKMDPYTIIISAGPTPGDKTFVATTELYYLPAKTTGSMVKIDNLNGGMLLANKVSKFAFEPILPFGMYTSCSGWLTSKANAQRYKDFGYTMIHPVCAFTDGDLSDMFNWMDDMNMPYQYDMRGSYYDLKSVAEQVPRIKDRDSFLSWYTADEPDGWQYAFKSTDSAYEYLKRVDPYHPVGLVLNCQNYYFDRYSAGADYIMEDAYPIGINPKFCPEWGTNCNSTYGDCGCDNCVGALHDVSDRLDDFRKYQTWLGRRQKPLWTVPQAFHSGPYWSRDPSPGETWAMNLLGFNHGSKGVMSWIFPASDTLNKAHGDMSKVFAAAPVRDFLLGSNPLPLKISGNPSLDVAYWKLGNQIMVGLVNQDLGKSTASSVRLPFRGYSVASQPWGSLKWSSVMCGLKVEVPSGVTTSVVILTKRSKAEDQTLLDECSE
ncbi:hypothetical protein K461DRAFT_284453 [Myriangium duriaei CBS 260.36]|uniref:Uncharacterized protein n=1 Tax=Myriangium duriaei CBS 260.36 TaxID=1168546 RepID=A0A9P4MM94_9PEZI|nr:hypothetical protein K461DRAFT_284453 [Myriangium duriaei CBS 260.36]